MSQVLILLNIESTTVLVREYMQDIPLFPTEQIKFLLDLSFQDPELITPKFMPGMLLTRPLPLLRRLSL